MFSALISFLSANFLYFILHISNTSSFPKPLKPKEEAEALARMKEGSADARALLIERNLRLVSHIVKKYYSKTNDTDDLISIGTIGLMKAVKTFNPEKNIKLATYASRCIENEILMHLRKVNNSKIELSFDEPLSIDWDGNELLLSDILGTDSDVISKDIEDEIDRKML